MSNAISLSTRTVANRHGRQIAALLGIGLSLSCIGDAAAQAFTHPNSAFVQSGSTQGTRALTVGLSWDLPYRWKLGPGELSSYLEVSYAYWQIQSENRAGLSHLSQFALIPALRYRPADGTSPWFLEAGVGLTATSSVYKTQEKSFSTSFNFGTHLAVGRSFGEQHQHEIALRFEHFSNASIKQPNPGENFIQIRYARRF